MEISRRDIEFYSEGDLVRGWLYCPEGQGAFPTIVMAHGFAAVKEMHLDDFASAFANAGFAALVFDYRRLGASEGRPRQEIHPDSQLEDYRNAVTFAGSLAEVDEGRIGLWGTSYSGGHVLVLAATDPRVGCVVSQVPTISGNAVTRRRFSERGLRQIVAEQAQDRFARIRGEAPAMRTLVSESAGDRPVYGSREAVNWYLAAADRGGHFENRVTLRSLEYSRAYEPGAYVPFVSPTPLLMIVAREDVVTPADLALAAYDAAGEPKRLCMLDGGHFQPYGPEFRVASQAAIAWFSLHL